MVAVHDSSVSATTIQHFNANPSLPSVQRKAVDIALVAFGLRRDNKNILVEKSILSKPPAWLTDAGADRRALLWQMIQRLQTLGNAELANNLASIAAKLLKKFS